MPLTQKEIWDGLGKIGRDWFSIYNYDHVGGHAYLEAIASWCLEHAAEISLDSEGQRKSGFRTAGHNGSADMTGVDKDKPLRMNEKRLVRAIFNRGNAGVLGTVKDYEVPLAQDGSHGDIDLLCSGKCGECFCVEVKSPDDGKSILKPLLQSYVYSSLVGSQRSVFLEEYEFSPDTPIVPAVLLFREAMAYRCELAAIDQHPQLEKLIALLNKRLDQRNIMPIRFFVLRNDADKLKEGLYVEEEHGCMKPAFHKDLDLIIEEITQTHPSHDYT